MIHPIELVFVLTALLVGLLIRGRFVARRHDREKALLKAGSPDRGRDEIALLKERLAVLERIATERDTLLEHEIERLRHR